MAISSINATLDALAGLVRAALPAVQVNAPDLKISETTTYPLVQVFPWRLHLERVATGQWGSAMWDQSHAHGPDLWRICVIQSPLLTRLDENATKRALNDNVDAIRAALIAHPGLPDSGGTEQALDVGEHILVEYDGQGELISWRLVSYIGAYITIDVQQLRQP